LIDDWLIVYLIIVILKSVLILKVYINKYKLNTIKLIFLSKFYTTAYNLWDFNVGKLKFFIISLMRKNFYLWTRLIRDVCISEIKSYTLIMYCFVSSFNCALYWNQISSNRTRHVYKRALQSTNRAAAAWVFSRKCRWNTHVRPRTSYVHCILLRPQLKFVPLLLKFVLLQFNYRTRNTYDKWLYDIPIKLSHTL